MEGSLRGSFLDRVAGKAACTVLVGARVRPAAGANGGEAQGHWLVPESEGHR